MESTTILVVCTANVRRSPAVAALLRHGTTTAPGLAGSGVEVVSAGVAALAGDRLDPRGIPAEELTPHLARRLTVEAVERADLVLTAERAHRAAVVRLVPAAVTRSFTVRELAVLGSGLGRSGLTAMSAPERVRELVRLVPLERARIQQPQPRQFRRRPSQAHEDLPDLRSRDLRRDRHSASRRLVAEMLPAVDALLGLLEPESDPAVAGLHLVTPPSLEAAG
jgi:protein-tyrosine phosphatase